jgi:hypothetical protein
MSKTVELHAEIVENDAGDIVMRLKRQEGSDHLSSRKRGVRTKGLQEAEGDPRPGTTEADRGQPAVGVVRPAPGSRAYRRRRLGHSQAPDALQRLQLLGERPIAARLEKPSDFVARRRIRFIRSCCGDILWPSALSLSVETGLCP